jgi:hypothetical protein
MGQTSKYLKIILIGSLSLLLGGLVVACATVPISTPMPQPTRQGVEVAEVPPPTPTTPASPTQPPPTIAPDDGCVACHTDQERLIATADEEEVVEELSEGEG